MRWLRRFVYLLIFSVWLMVMIFPCMAFTLAMEQQIALGQEESSHIRIFLLQEPKKEGVAVEWKRPSTRQSNCLKTSVTYLMWVGEGENTVYCQCIDPQTGQTRSADPQTCRLP
ncbi:MAG: hypothetical protein IPM39_17640 [Chloroflexi bacterium]|nr:hypothetical protein [Chloroflexota bacterium]